MAAEGIFPKIDGDALFASEANILPNATQTFIIGSSFPTIGSQTAEQNIGSVVIPAGNLSNPCMIDGDCFINNENNDLNIQISGLSANATINAGATFGNSYIRFTGIIGSPFTGIISAFAGGGQNTNVDMAAGFLTDLDTTQDVVITYKGTFDSSTTLTSYIIKMNNKL